MTKHRTAFLLCSIQLIQDLQCLFCMELPTPDKQNRLLSCKSQLALVSRQLAITLAFLSPIELDRPGSQGVSWN